MYSSTYMWVPYFLFVCLILVDSEFLKTQTLHIWKAEHKLHAHIFTAGTCSAPLDSLVCTSRDSCASEESSPVFLSHTKLSYALCHHFIYLLYLCHNFILFIHFRECCISLGENVVKFTNHSAITIIHKFINGSGRWFKGLYRSQVILKPSDLDKRCLLVNHKTWRNIKAKELYQFPWYSYWHNYILSNSIMSLYFWCV